MNDENKISFWEIVLDGVVEKVGNEINKRILNVIPHAFNWIENNGVEKCKQFVLTYMNTKSEQLSKNNALNEINKLGISLEKCKFNMNDKEAQKELIEAIVVEISNDSLLWESLSLFIQEIECPYCSENISENWYDYIHDEFSSERNMGLETIYSIECDEFQCPKCKRLFLVNGFIESYPDGIYNYHNLKASAI